MARVSAVNYRETIWSDLFVGKRLSVTCLRVAVLAAENALELAPERRKRVVWRLDGGFGSDDNLRWLLARDYQVLAKGYSGRRAQAIAQQVTRWDRYGDAWLGEVPAPVDFGREVQVLVKRRLKNGRFYHSYYVNTLKFSSKRSVMARYDNRGGAEVEQFRNDKQGLFLSARRKQGFLAQKSLILLTDVAHNLLADFHHSALVGTKFESFGLKRIVRDLLAIPGMLIFERPQLKRIELLDSHPHAKTMIACLQSYLIDG